MKKYLILFFLSIYFTPTQSQSVIFYHDYNKTLGNNYYTSAVVCDTTEDGNYLVAGSSSGISGSVYLYGIISPNGNVLWEKDSAVYGDFDIHQASFYSGKRTLDNGFVFCGTLINYGDPLSQQAIFILKTDSAGNELWRKYISQFQSGGATSIYLDSDSSLFFTGFTSDSISGNEYSYLLKLSANGDSLFMKKYPMIQGFGESIFKIDDKFFIGGVTSHYDSVWQTNTNGFYFISTDTLGNYLSSHFLFDSALSINPQSILRMSDNNILLSCSITDTASNGITQLLKVDTSAAIIWKDTVVNVAYSTSSSCELTDGNILISYGNNQVQKFNSNGDTIWTRNFADTSYHGFASTEATSIFPLNNSTFLISASVRVSAPGGSWAYLTKISDSVFTGISDVEKTILFIYPNPTTNTFAIKNISSNKRVLLQIFNPAGQIIYAENLFGKNEYKVDANLKRGIYLVSITDGEKNIVRKLIVE